MKTTSQSRLIALWVVLGVSCCSAQVADSVSGIPFPDSLIPKNPQLIMEAMAYHQARVAPLQEVREANYNYLQAVTRIRKARAVEKKRLELLKALQTNRDFVRGSQPFHGDSTLKTELIRYLDLITIVLKEDFGKILDMEDISAQSNDETEAHHMAIDLAVVKLHTSFEVLHNAEMAFFKKYGIRSIDQKDKLDLKIERANKAIAYYDTIYRIFFKANHQNSYANQAMIAKDAAGLQQHATTLVSFAEQGLEQLKQKHGYEGDSELLATAVKTLEFYRHAGLSTYPANIDFDIKTDNLRTAEKKINAVKEKDRTQEDVNQYNSEVSMYNAAAKEINRVNNASYKTHKRLIKLWNKKVKDFFKKHS